MKSSMNLYLRILWWMLSVCTGKFASFSSAQWTGWRVQVSYCQNGRFWQATAFLQIVWPWSLYISRLPGQVQNGNGPFANEKRCEIMSISGQTNLMQFWFEDMNGSCAYMKGLSIYSQLQAYLLHVQSQLYYSWGFYRIRFIYLTLHLLHQIRLVADLSLPAILFVSMNRLL